MIREDYWIISPVYQEDGVQALYVRGELSTSYSPFALVPRSFEIGSEGQWAARLVRPVVDSFHVPMLTLLGNLQSDLRAALD